MEQTDDKVHFCQDNLSLSHRYLITIGGFSWPTADNSLNMAHKIVLTLTCKTA